jgi:hypothetical protein
MRLGPQSALELRLATSLGERRAMKLTGDFENSWREWQLLPYEAELDEEEREFWKQWEREHGEPFFGCAGIPSPLLQKLGLSYAIKDSDCDLVAAIVDSSGWSTLAALATGHISIGAVVAVLLWARKLANAAVKLDSMQIAVIRALRCNQRSVGKAVDTVRDYLELDSVSCTPAQVEDALRSLTAIARGDGTVLALVNQDARGLWTVAGV